MNVRKPATIREDWKLPEPPPGGPWYPQVVDVGDDWERVGFTVN